MSIFDILSVVFGGIITVLAVISWIYELVSIKSEKSEKNHEH